MVHTCEGYIKGRAEHMKPAILFVDRPWMHSDADLEGMCY